MLSTAHPVPGYRLTLAGTALLVLLAGCGVGGGGSSADASPSTPTGRALGARAVPGGVVSVSSTGPITVGSAASFRITLSGFAAAPTAVEARIGSAYDPDAAMTSASPGSDGYDLALTIPSDAKSVWVRLRFADGSVVETGADDFALGGG